MEGDLRTLPIDLDQKELLRLLNSFVTATNMGVTLLDEKGTSFYTPEPAKRLCPFCARVRACAEGQARCLASMTQAGRFAAQLGEPYIYRCHAGLIEIASPIIVSGEYLGSLSCGPALMWDWDELAVRELLDRTRDLPIEEEALLVASRSIREFTSANIQAAADILFVMVNYIARTGMATLALRREVSAQQAAIATILEGKKKRDSTLHRLEHGESGYPLGKERELLGKVRLGDRNAARGILNELLAHIFVHSAGDLEVLKARVLELIVMISRAAVEAGASLEKLLGMNYRLVTELGDATEFDTVCAWVVRGLNAFMDEVYATRNVKNAGFLQEALSYIRENYAGEIGLEEVARHVHISPFYLSHLFKEELDITFIEYLTRVRMEEARRLVETTSLSVGEIAARVGYEDGSYFAKVFSRTYGMTPIRFRKRRV